MTHTENNNQKKKNNVILEKILFPRDFTRAIVL